MSVKGQEGGLGGGHFGPEAQNLYVYVIITFFLIMASVKEKISTLVPITIKLLHQQTKRPCQRGRTSKVLEG